MPEDRPTFDLQSHSLHSDGTLRPAEVVVRAAAAGVELLALSDHDTVAGVQEALDAAAMHGIAVVPAIEISTVDPAGSDLHILGYGIDHRDPGLAATLEEFRADRGRRGWAMVAALRELGFAVDEEALRRRTAHGQALGRPHIAQATFEHPANRERLAAEGLTDPIAFLKAYLIEGRPAFSRREQPTVADAVRCIHAAGGVAIWAHPFWDISSPDDVLATLGRFRALGLDGVECFYTTHTQAQTGIIAKRCRELGLLSTGSADFHGPEHRIFSHFRAFSTFGHAPELGAIPDAARAALRPRGSARADALRPCA